MVVNACFISVHILLSGGVMSLETRIKCIPSTGVTRLCTVNQTSIVDFSVMRVQDKIRFDVIL